MEVVSDLNTFAKILIDKGYNGYFLAQDAYGGKLKDSIQEYLEHQKDSHSLPKQELLLTAYLLWAGEDKPRVECSMWVKYLNGKFFLDRMEIAKKDCFGHLLKKVELTNLSVMTVPEAVNAIALVNMVRKEKAKKRPSYFKRQQQK
ncbi:MAG TPA: hypothetical protein VLB84_09340 [Bacteroidia bacterium]|nr:hypothetical protein [Bacteroidia bacterium]